MTTKGDCLPCGAFKTRLSRALKLLRAGGEPHSVTDYNKLTDEEKINFRRNHWWVYGSSLIQAIKLLTKNSDLVGRALATSHIMDEAELEEKSKAKLIEELLKERENIQLIDSMESAVKKQKTKEAPPTDSEETTLTPEKAPPTDSEGTTLTPLERVKLRGLCDGALQCVITLHKACSEATCSEFRDYLSKKLLWNMLNTIAHLLSEIVDIELICKGGNIKFTLPELNERVLYIIMHAQKKCEYVRESIVRAEAKWGG